MAFVVGFGSVANPWLTSAHQVLIFEVLAATTWLGYEFWRRRGKIAGARRTRTCLVHTPCDLPPGPV